MMVKVAVLDESIVVRDPIDMLKVPVSGKVVELTTYWIRRIKAGDVVQLPLEGEEDAN